MLERQKPQRKRQKNTLPENVWDITDVVVHQQAGVDPDTMIVYGDVANERIGTYHVIPGLGGAIVEDSDNPKQDEKTRKLLRRFARSRGVNEHIDPNNWHSGRLDVELPPHLSGWGKPGE